MDKEAGLYYNISLFGHDLHLRLRPNSRLIAPTATVEWWEGSGDRHSQPIGDTDCFYTGQVSNMEDTSVAICNCDGMVGANLPQVVFCITSPLLPSKHSLPPYQVTFIYFLFDTFTITPHHLLLRNSFSLLPLYPFSFPPRHQFLFTIFTR